MGYHNLQKGDIILYQNEYWAQYVCEKNNGIELYDGLKYFCAESKDIELTPLPLALDGLGFKLVENLKKGTEKYKRHKLSLTLIESRYFIDSREVFHTSDVQHACNLHQLIPFHILERRMKNKSL